MLKLFQLLAKSTGNATLPLNYNTAFDNKCGVPEIWEHIVYTLIKLSLPIKVGLKHIVYTLI